MKDIKSLMDYFIGVNNAHGEGYFDIDIDAHLRLFCEQLQAKINHPFSDGGPEYDDDDYRCASECSTQMFQSYRGADESATCRVHR